MARGRSIAKPRGDRNRSALVAAVAVLAVATSAATAGEGRSALPDDRLGVRTAPLLLLSRADIRTDLALTPQQADSAERAISDLYVRAAALRGKSGTGAIEARKAIDDAQKTWIESSLTAEQRTRLLQLDLQWEGPSALVSRPVVADSLSITAAQRQAIEQAVASRNRARSSGKATQADEAALAKTALAVLQPDQRTRWHAMLGKPFTPQLQAVAAGASPAIKR